jgi:hypothetical protein
MKMITKSLYPVLTTLALALTSFALSPAGQAAPTEPAKLDKATQARVSRSYGKLPLSFEANEGQQDEQVKFLCRGSRYDLFLADREAVLVLTKPENPASPPARKATLSQKNAKARSTVLRAKLIAANRAAKVIGEEELPGKVNYLIGNDPSKWRTDVVTYAKVRYEEVYPGVDLVYYGNQGQLEYDFVVGPGADPACIRLKIAGAQKMRVNGKGQLVMKTAGGAVRWNKPEIYQEVDGQQRSVKGKYVLGRGHEVGFQVAAYDTAKPLIIDPTLVYSTYLGGGNLDDGWGIAVDSSGNAYVTGHTYSTDFPTTAGAFQTTFNGSIDAFVTKLNSSGTGLLYSTYLGGSDVDFGYGMAVDTSGNAHVAGETASSDFPITAGAFQTTYAGGDRDAFVIQLNATGTSLLYSTYLGGSGNDRSAHLGGIALDTSGNAYIVGDTASSDFPTTAGAFQTTFAGGRDAFVTKFNATGSSLLYSTYLGGSALDFGSGIALDISGNAYLTGRTESFDFPSTAGAFQATFAGGRDAFVTKLNSSGSSLLYSTYLGGSNSDDGSGIAVDASGNAYVTGLTGSSDFPITAGAFQTTLVASGDAFVTELNSIGTGLLYSTYLGGSGGENGWGIAVDSSGNAYVAGFTDSSDFPTTADAFQTTFGGVIDVFVTQLNPTGTGLLYSTYLGGSPSQWGGGYEFVRGIALDTSNNVYIVGVTTSSDFPTTPGAFQTTWNLSSDGFVAKIGTPPAPAPAAPTALKATNVTATSFTAKWSSVSGATGYRLDVATNSSFTTYVPGYQDLDVGNTTSRNVTGLTANTTYYYRLRAYNGNGTSPNSNVVTVKTKRQ